MKNTLMLSAVALALAGSAFAASLRSGFQTGERIVPFHPTFVTGELAGKDACFPCTYKAAPQAQVWVNGDDMGNVKALASTLNAAQNQHKDKGFRALVVFLVPEGEHKNWTTKLQDFAKKENMSNLSMALLDPKNKYVAENKIDMNAKNTVIFYRGWQVTSNWVNVKADESGKTAVQGAIRDVLK